jgi:DNA-binding beta-propeller fold protein YncE
MPGRTRWAVFDPARRRFFVNVMDPAVIVGVEATGAVVTTFEVPARGPHGLDLDVSAGRLYCACDDGTLAILDAGTGEVCGTVPLSGAPDVVFLDVERARLYVAIGDPGVIDVVDVASGRLADTVATEAGAHTLAFERGRGRVFALLPRTHRAAVFEPAMG